MSKDAINFTAGFVTAQHCTELSCELVEHLPFPPWTGCSSACFWFRNWRHLTNLTVKTLSLAYLRRGGWHLHSQFSKANNKAKMAWESAAVKSVNSLLKYSKKRQIFLYRANELCSSHRYFSGKQLSRSTPLLHQVTSAITSNLAFWVMLIAIMNPLVTAQAAPHHISPLGLLDCCNAPEQDSVFIGSLLESSLGLNESSRRFTHIPNEG